MLQADYIIETLDQPYKGESLFPCPKTVMVRTSDNGLPAEEHEFGWVDPEEIYKKIIAGEVIDLNGCYVKNFSLSVLREQQKLDAREYLDIAGFSAKGAFFDCDSDIDFSYARFSDEAITFSGARFAKGKVNFHHTIFGDGDADFSLTEFGHGEVDFQFAEFGEGEITFKNALFLDGDVSFVSCQFGNGRVDFRHCNFGNGNLSYHFVKFGEGEVTFESAQFGNGDVDFRKVEFGDGKKDFRRTQFGTGTISFDESEFGTGRTNFNRANFADGNISFESCQFGNEELTIQQADFGTGTLSLLKASLGRLSLQSCHLDNYVDLRVDNCQSIDLRNTIVRDIIDIRPGFSKAEIGELRLTGMRDLGRIFMDWKGNNVKNLIASQADTSQREMAEQYLILKEDFRESGQYNDEDSAYVAFKRMELKADIKEAIATNPLNALWIYPLAAFKWLVFDRIGLYATDPIRVLISMLLIYCCFSMAYVILPEFTHSDVICTGADNDRFPYITLAFYYSAITFLTIGYGDCLPEGHLKWIAPVEGWMGMFLMAYFTVAFVRKILR